MFDINSVFVKLNDYQAVISNDGHVCVILDDDFFYRFSIDENGNFYLLDDKKDEGEYLYNILYSQKTFKPFDDYYKHIFSSNDLPTMRMIGEDGNIYYENNRKENQKYRLYEPIDDLIWRGICENYCKKLSSFYGIEHILYCK